ncbi:hypothetical protein AURDEDRAFT_172629 [Auricularia subglabra TFB-10046 SS5]|nr:hypothetical protein AURDEDRAFT_172629 [Auricularia subglabra TFB-10046 SS5]
MPLIVLGELRARHSASAGASTQSSGSMCPVPRRGSRPPQRAKTCPPRPPPLSMLASRLDAILLRTWTLTRQLNGQVVPPQTLPVTSVRTSSLNLQRQWAASYLCQCEAKMQVHDASDLDDRMAGDAAVRPLRRGKSILTSLKPTKHFTALSDNRKVLL